MKKAIIALATTLTVGTVSTVFASPDSFHSVTEDKQLSEKFQQLSRSNDWKQTKKVNLQFDTFHPQGMTKIGDLYYMSSVEIIERPVKYNQPLAGYDRSPGKGVGHLFVFNEEGKLLEDVTFADGNMYHPGGIAYDGENIWVSVAEYRPNSESIIYRVNPKTMISTEMFRTSDHIGGITRDEQKGTLKAVSWGSRTFYEFTEKGKVLSTSSNPSHFIDYQDCEDVGKDNIICSGITELPQQGLSSIKYELGGLALLDKKTMGIVHELPISLMSPQEHVVTRNPVFLETTTEGIKMYAVPDDDVSSLLVYETETK